MRIYISADGEGISSVVSGSGEMYPGSTEYNFFRTCMTEDVNAAIAGAFDAGASSVVVNDTHWTERNILPDLLDPRAELMRGSGKPLSMMEGVQTGVDAVFFVGYHSRVGGSIGVANETVMGRQIYDVRINGESIGELEINAAIAGHFGVPVILATGDDHMAKEARAILPDVHVAIVKHAIERWSARCLSPQHARALIREQARQAVTALKDLHKPRLYVTSGTLHCEVEFVSTAHAGAASLMPGVTRLGPRTVSYEAPDAIVAMRAIFAMMFLGCAATDEHYG